MKSPKSKTPKTVIDKVKTSALAFKHLPQESAQEFLDQDDVTELSNQLCEYLKIDNISFEVKSGVLLDYYVSAIWWGKEQGFDAQKLSGLFSIVHLLLEGIRQDHLSHTDNMLQFKQLIAGIGLEEIPDENTGGLEFFSVDDIKSINDYVTRTIFQHHNLIEFLFTCSPAEEILGTDLTIDFPPLATLPYPPPLAEAVALDDYTDYIKPPEPQDLLVVEEPLPGEGADGGGGDESARALTSDEILAKLTPEEVQKVIDEVCREMLGSMENEVAVRLRDKENHFISKINAIHRVQD